MKENKPLRTEMADQNSPRAEQADERNGTGKPGLSAPLRLDMVKRRTARPELAMSTATNRSKQRGKLSRDALVRIGSVLEAYFDDVRNEGVPDRFKQILERDEAKGSERRDDERKDKGTS
jgi:hypothetical protein